MYQKYSTEALVLGSSERGESDRMYALYTHEFGLVRGRASAVRTEASRMRYALQHYSLARVSLVRGKRGWRVAGASALRSARQGEAAAAFARIAELALRLIAEEEKHAYLFAALAEAHTELAREGAPLGVIEIVCVARVLYALGYLSSEALPAGRQGSSTALFTHTAYTGESLLEAETLKDKLLLSINRAIAEAQL